MLQGALADAIGIHHCFVVPALCYVYIAWYGLTFRAPDKTTARGRLRGRPRVGPNPRVV